MTDAHTISRRMIANQTDSTFRRGDPIAKPRVNWNLVYAAMGFFGFGVALMLAVNVSAIGQGF